MQSQISEDILSPCLCARTELHTHQESTLIQVCQAEAERRQDELPCYR